MPEEATTTSITGLIIMGIILVQLLASLLWFFSIKKKGEEEYGGYMEDIEHEDLKKVKSLPVGMYLCANYAPIERMPTFIQTAYRRYQFNLKSQVLTVYGSKYIDFYFFAYESLKKLYMLYVYLFTTFLAAILALQGDYSTALIVDGAGIAAAISVQFLYDSTLKSRIEKKAEAMRREFPEFVNKMVLLINAGMTITKVWQKIAAEDETNTPLMVEIKHTWFDIQNGMGEAAAIDNFGRRCKVKEIMKFTTTISGNLKKGGADLLPVLMQQSRECWDMRCTQAKEDGAKLSSKMVLPVMMLLCAILVVVAGPAMLSMGGM